MHNLHVHYLHACYCMSVIVCVTLHECYCMSDICMRDTAVVACVILLLLLLHECYCMSGICMRDTAVVARLGVKYISKYLSKSTSTFNFSQVQVHHLINKRYLITMQILVKVLKYKYV